MTGCNSIDNFIKISQILCDELVRYKPVYDRKIKKIVDIDNRFQLE